MNAQGPVIYTDEARSILLTVWPDGQHEVALRDEHRRWLPPVRLLPEPKTPAELVEQSLASAEAERRARLDAGLARRSS